MQRELYEVEKDRFDLKDSSLYHLQGTWPKDHKPEAVLDGEKLPAAISAQERVSALERFKDLDLVNGERVQMEICLPDLEGKKKLVVYAVKGEKRVRWFSVPAAQLYRKQGKPQYFIESIEVEAGEKICRVRGWAAFNLSLIHIFREGSKTFGKWYGVVLSAENKKQFFIPKGFAHGFLVLSENAEFTYKCSDFYHPNDEGGLIWNDKDINVEWPIPEGMELIFSDKDQKWGSFEEYKNR